MHEGESRLAAAILQQALEDFKAPIKKSFSSKKKLKMRIEKDSARNFLKGDSDSLLQSYCDLAGISRQALQERIF